MSEVANKLKEMGLEKFGKQVKKNGYDDIDDWPNLSDSELKEIGIKAGWLRKWRKKHPDPNSKLKRPVKSANQPTKDVLNITVLGAGAVGKSCLTLRLVWDRFDEAYDPTIEDVYRQQFNIDGEESVLHILDTAGQEEFSVLADSWIRNGDGYLLVYSIANPQTLEKCKEVYQQICRINEVEPGEFPLVLVGNKKDLVDERTVRKEVADDVANGWNCPHMETSAKNNENVVECFHQCAREIRKLKSKTTEKSDTSANDGSCCNIL